LSRTPPPSTRDELQAREIVARYAGVGNRMRLGRLRFHSKRAVFVLVVFGAQVLKRLVDLVFAATALAVLVPLFLSIALAIRLESPGPVFFRQKRIGAQGRPFTMIKFRSMYVDAEQRKLALVAQNEMQGGVIFKMKRDPRVTRVGRFLRKASIDELPQLWNVVKGEMSLVGPRPPVPSEVADYTLKDHRRLDVTPGITCIWQVSGRSDIPFEQQVELDALYIESQSFWGDVKLLLRTIPAVLLGRGAY